MTRTLISDRIDVPKRITRDDFVLKLTDSLANSREVVRNHVVTPRIATARRPWCGC